ncbi:prohibitin family protein [uncultured Cohaesibacter sp.]|uniref:prohibitin family protein n=1 Tax=uncultured Cohaesibacter sp. TaxID=1002546 RepID=UPI0029C6885F|nr:prohibitin family protein [uncultured Cohaesibacter sp.]
MGKFIASAVGIIIIAATLFLMLPFYTVDQGELGVVKFNGKVTEVAEPGLHFKMPILERVAFVSVRSQASRYENVAAYSKDQQPANMVLSINYHADPSRVKEVYSRFGSVSAMVSRLVTPKLYEQTKNVFGQYTAVTSISDRARLNTEIQNAMQEAVVGPIIIESVQIENLDFSDAYEISIEERMKAEVAVEKQRQEALKEKVSAEITVTKAKAAADAERASADAEAYSVKIKGDAEAAAIRAKGEALRDNPALVSLVSAEKWDGVLPGTMVPGAALPFVNVK